MITSIKDTNADQYSILFSKAVKDLMSHDEEGNLIRTPGQGVPCMAIENVTFTEEKPYVSDTYYYWDAENECFELSIENTPDPEKDYYELKASQIESLNEYFSYIISLSKINPIYTVLALDEPTFDIDLNTREIKVPDHFQKNGVSVEGDEIAEIVYFKVNRYFDMIDLATQNIYIQWRSAATDEEGEYIEGVSTPWCIDLDTYPGYILFGWPISSKITAKAGQIAFAVRFYNYDTLVSESNPLVYSLSTLTQVVTVKPALNFDLVEKILREQMPAEGFVDDNNAALIRNRLIDTEPGKGGADPAEAPIFRINLNPDGVTLEEGVKEAWMDENDADFRIVARDVKVQAYTTDAGTISYKAVKLDFDTNDEDRTYDLGTEVFEETSDTAKQNNKKYYYAVSQGQHTSYREIEDFSEYPFDKTAEDYKTIYERFYQITLDTIGKYKVIAQNRVLKKMSKTASYLLVVSRPADVAITTAPATRGVLGAEPVVLSVVAAASDSDHSKFTYQWLRKPLDNSNASYEAIDGATESSYTVSQEGYYKVTVHNNLHVEKVSGTPVMCFTSATSEQDTRITNPAAKCTVTPVGALIKNMTTLQNEPFKITYELPAAETNKHTSEDSVTYQWYDYNTAPGHDLEEDEDLASEGLYETQEEYDLPISGATQSTFTPPTGSAGQFYCQVTNYYNGSEAKINSPFFTIGG